MLSIENFQIIAQWYHFAILSLTNLKGFRGDLGWIARRLKIRLEEAEVAVGRLLTLGLLERTPKGWKAVNDADIGTTSDVSSEAIRENHSQHLTLAQTALRELPIDRREFNNLTLAMNLSDVPRAKAALREFIEKFNREHETVPGQELFQLNVQFYQITRSERGTP